MPEPEVITKNRPAGALPETGFIVLIDKEDGWTSFDAVARMRKILNTRKIGHGGTLDPFATGLLILLTGKATKLQDTITGSDKVYQAELLLGERTDTFDRTGTVTEISEKIITEDRIREAVSDFLGESFQIPPMFSAVKKDGRRLYELARKGLEVEREPRKINIRSIDVLEITGRTVKIEVACSKGTYIRSLADDIGKKLGTFAHLKELRRTGSGPFKVGDAFKINDFAEYVKSCRA